MTFADLAGVEKAGGKTKGKDDSKTIKSLNAMHNCITVLAENRPGKHVPYRESKLTRILADSLGGNSRTTFIACISPSLAKYEETLSTLMFATSAAKVRTYPVANEDVRTLKRPGEEAKEKTPRKPVSAVKEGLETTSTKQSVDDPRREDSPVISFIAQTKTRQEAKTPDKSRNRDTANMGESRSVDRIQAEKRPIRKENGGDSTATATTSQNNVRQEEGLPVKKQVAQRVDEANKIVRRLAQAIRYLKGEITKKACSLTIALGRIWSSDGSRRKTPFY